MANRQLPTQSELLSIVNTLHESTLHDIGVN